jgi:hypothetical protein
MRSSAAALEQFRLGLSHGLGGLLPDCFAASRSQITAPFLASTRPLWLEWRKTSQLMYPLRLLKFRSRRNHFESSMLMINPQHLDSHPLQAHLA